MKGCLGPCDGLVNHTLSSSHRTGRSEEQESISRAKPEEGSPTA